MNHLAALFSLLGHLSLPSPDIMNVPLASLTLKMIFDKLISVGLLVGSIYMGVKSLTEDKIWPWRWNSLFLADWLFAICVSGVVFYFLSVWVGNTGHPFLNFLYGTLIAASIYGYYLFAGYVQEAGKRWQANNALDTIQHLQGGDRNYALQNIQEYIDDFYKDKKRFPTGNHSVDIDWNVKHQFNFQKPSLINALLRTPF
jgi:hypothetical protein